MSIIICADSTCDLSADLIKKYNITIFPLAINLADGETKKDGLEITVADIFKMVAEGQPIPATSATNFAEYYTYFEPLAKENDAVIFIGLGSGFSSSFSNAAMAAKEFDNVYAVDSQNLSTGQGLVVLAAAEMRDAGKSAEEICAALNDLVPRVESSFVLDNLEYLKKGGRCSSIAALGANMLHLRPCIMVRDGQMQVGKKYRGAMDKCISQYIKDRLANRDDLDLSRIFVTHSEAEASLVATAHAAVAEHANFAEVLETTAGCTVCCHCGPNTLGVLFIHK